MVDHREPGGDTAADALRRRVSGDEIGILALEPLELLDERVELDVGNLGIVEDVIALFVVPDLSAEFVDPFGRSHDARRTYRSREMT
jgi:hypothetical protein